MKKKIIVKKEKYIKKNSLKILSISQKHPTKKKSPTHKCHMSDQNEKSLIGINTVYIIIIKNKQKSKIVKNIISIIKFLVKYTYIKAT